MILPNSFQSPNDYVDVAMQYLKPQEYLCLSFAARHILGWQDKIATRRGCISLSMFENGFTDSTGKHYGGTGLSRVAILNATKELDRFCLLVKLGKPTVAGQEWKLGEDREIRWDLLTHRRDEAKAKGRKDTAKARQTLKEQQADSQLVQLTSGQSDIPVVSPTNQSQLVQLTSGGQLNIPNQSQVQNHSQNQNGAPNGADSGVPSAPSKKKGKTQKPTLEETLNAYHTVNTESVDALRAALGIDTKFIKWTEQTTKERRAIMDVHSELVGAGLVSSDFKRLVDFVTPKRSWKKRPLQVAELLEYVTEYRQHKAQSKEGYEFVPEETPPAPPAELTDVPTEEIDLAALAESKRLKV